MQPTLKFSLPLPPPLGNGFPFPKFVDDYEALIYELAGAGLVPHAPEVPLGDVSARAEFEAPVHVTPEAVTRWVERTLMPILARNGYVRSVYPEWESEPVRIATSNTGWKQGVVLFLTQRQEA